MRLHIAHSTFPEVRAHAAEIEALVLKEGRNAVMLPEHPLERALLDERASQRAERALKSAWMIFGVVPPKFLCLRTSSLPASATSRMT